VCDNNGQTGAAAARWSTADRLEGEEATARPHATQRWRSAPDVLLQEGRATSRPVHRPRSRTTPRGAVEDAAREERQAERRRRANKERRAMDLEDPDNMSSFKREFLDDLEDSLSTRERPGRRRERRSSLDSVGVAVPPPIM